VWRLLGACPSSGWELVCRGEIPAINATLVKKSRNFVFASAFLSVLRIRFTLMRIRIRNFYLMRIRIRLFTSMGIRIQILASKKGLNPGKNVNIGSYFGLTSAKLMRIRFRLINFDADPNADPYPDFFFDADPDPDANPGFQYDADPDANPGYQNDADPDP
jgi:hypothetical protein